MYVTAPIITVNQTKYNLADQTRCVSMSHKIPHIAHLTGTSGVLTKSDGIRNVMLGQTALYNSFIASWPKVLIIYSMFFNLRCCTK